MHNDVTRPERQYGRCSHAQYPRWRQLVLVVVEIVKVWDLELDPKTNDQTVVVYMLPSRMLQYTAI